MMLFALHFVCDSLCLILLFAQIGFFVNLFGCLGVCAA